MDGRKRGRPYRHWAEHLRIAIWYKEVKRQSDWSDYALDNEFAWTELGQELKRGVSKLSTTDRPRIFEWIRKKGKRPSGKDERWRDMGEIVTAVDNHYLFKNTKAIYTAKFWDLLQMHKITASDIEAGMELLLNKFDLMQISYKTTRIFNSSLDKYKLTEVYDRCLRISLRRLDVLSGIELLWYLNLMAEPVYEIRQVIEKIADVKIEQFFTRYFPDTEALGYYDDAINSFRRARLYSELTSERYGFLEDKSQLLILPRDWESRDIDEDCLFPKIAV